MVLNLISVICIYKSCVLPRLDLCVLSTVRITAFPDLFYQKHWVCGGKNGIAWCLTLSCLLSRNKRSPLFFLRKCISSIIRTSCKASASMSCTGKFLAQTMASYSRWEVVSWDTKKLKPHRNNSKLKQKTQGFGRIWLENNKNSPKLRGK